MEASIQFFAPSRDIHKQMRQRCENPNAQRYSSYGARGIRVHESWRSFWDFIGDVGPRPVGKSIDRINNDGNYEPGNCRWATDAEQTSNKRSQCGERNPHARLTWKIVEEIRSSVEAGGPLAARFGISQGTVSMVRNRKIWK